MTKLPYRGSIAVVFLVALGWSKAAEAQSNPVEPGGLVNNLATGVQHDIVNQGMAEHDLRHLQAKFRRHAAAGNSTAMYRDMGRIENKKFRIVVDEWLIRKNMGLDPGCYPYPVCLDPISNAAIAQYHRPWQGR